jgi:hypothetical protein
MHFDSVGASPVGAPVGVPVAGTLLFKYEEQPSFAQRFVLTASHNLYFDTQPAKGSTGADPSLWRVGARTTQAVQIDPKKTAPSFESRFKTTSTHSP